MKLAVLALFIMLNISYKAAGQEQVKVANDRPEQIFSGKSEAYKTETILLSYKDVPLVDVLNEFAALTQQNLLLPQGTFAITARTTIQMSHPVTLECGWNIISNALSLAGYTCFKSDGMIRVSKLDKDSSPREPLSVYIDVPIDELPNNGLIRTIFFLSNIKVGDPSGPYKDVKEGILDKLLSPTGLVQIDTKTNALIITEQAPYVKSAMRLVQLFDNGGAKDGIKIQPLFYVQAKYVEALLNEKLLVTGAASGTPTPGLGSASYFPRNTRVLALERSNSVVIMGNPQALDTLADFIIKYLDKPLESGDNVVHIYDLQYLKAEDFAQILIKFLQSDSSSTGQATTGAGTATGGTRKDFQGVVVIAEPTTLSKNNEGIKGSDFQSSANTTTSPLSAPSTLSTNGVQQGGNRLIIAAKRTDWERIEPFIKALDKPQPQIALEVFVVDLTEQGARTIANQMRNKESFSDFLGNSVNFQSAQISNPVLTVDGTNVTAIDPSSSVNFTANALMSNLLALSGTANPTNIANSSPFGSLIISFRDAENNGIWNLLQVLQQYAHVTVLSQPFAITGNNVQVTLASTEVRLLTGDASSNSGAINLKLEQIPAGIVVDVKPRINLDNNINLQVIVNASEFISSTNNSRTTRNIVTNANVGNGQVLILGGLVRLNESVINTQVPLLGNIPLVGWFFKGTKKVTVRSNLMIFICPTIIEPRTNGGFGMFTKNKLAIARENMEGGVALENLRDPITRWFFKPDPDYPQEVIDDFSAQIAYQTPTAKHRALVDSKQENEIKTEVIVQRPDMEQIKEQAAQLDIDAIHKQFLALAHNNN